MDTVQARQDVINWITGFVEKPNPLLNGWAPCPYARAARIRGEVDIQIGTDPAADLEPFIQLGMGTFGVVTLIYDAAVWDLEKFRNAWQSQIPYLKKQDLYVLEDHPSEPETVNGVTMNQGQYALLFVQLKPKLEEAARQLAQKCYYHDWPQDYLSGLFEGREDPTIT
jgi:hypothetical protein